MTKLLSSFFFLISYVTVIGQSLDEPFSKKKMRQDLEINKEIRLKVNSGLYKYRTEQQIDSIYNWAEKEIENASTYLDFYNIICQLTDFEGSLHNDTNFPSKYWKNIRTESFGYFPYPIKWIDGQWRVNYKSGEIPLGAEIISINQKPISEITRNLYKYYSTDGINTTGKRIGLQTHFSRYYRWNYGLSKDFEVLYKHPNSNQVYSKIIQSVAYSSYYKNFNSRYSKPYDQIYYTDLDENEKYNYRQINDATGVLTIYTFSMGNETADEHKKYSKFLDSVFLDVKINNIKNLIVDVRQNGGGTDPNDLITYAYLTQRNFQENKEAWISFEKIPLIKHIDSWIPKFVRPLFVGKYNKEFQEEFPLIENSKFFQDDNSQDHLIRQPNTNAFKGKIYLLISPAIASAGSLFASMVAGNENTIIIGEETMGGYYGHNGHTSLTYKLPNYKIKITFSVVNIEQDVPKKSNQFYNRGITPDFNVCQTYQDFLDHKDTQMEYTLELIKKEK